MYLENWALQLTQSLKADKLSRRVKNDLRNNLRDENAAS